MKITVNKQKTINKNFIMYTFFNCLSWFFVCKPEKDIKLSSLRIRANLINIYPCLISKNVLIVDPCTRDSLFSKLLSMEKTTNPQFQMKLKRLLRPMQPNLHCKNWGWYQRIQTILYDLDSKIHPAEPSLISWKIMVQDCFEEGV